MAIFTDSNSARVASVLRNALRGRGLHRGIVEMTSINNFVTSDAVHLFTDAGLMDSGCTKLEAVASKAALLPEYHAVFAANGMVFIEQLLRAVLA